VRGSTSARSLLKIFVGLSLLMVAAASFAGTAGAASIASWRGGSGSVPQVVTAADGNCPGTVIMITGSGFVTDGGTVSVSIGGTKSPQVIVGSDQYVYALVGAGTQSGPVVVTTGAGSVTAAAPAIVYPCQSSATASAAPTISSVSPAKAKPGKKIKIAGANFVGTTSVTLGGDKVAYAIPSDGLMYVIIPSGTKTGSTQIEVTNNKGTAKSSVTVT
jgi:hypothetical protein